MPYCSFPHPQFHRSIFATNLDYFPHQIFRGGPPFCTSSRFNPFLRILLCSDYVFSLLQGLCQPILRQQRGGCAQRHIQADSNRCAPNVPPCWSFPTTPGAGDGRKDSLHLGHQVFHLVSQNFKHRNRYTETNLQCL